MAKDRWPELCKAVEQDDGLPTWEDAGHWTEDKLYFWYRYVEITTNAMVGNPAFPHGLVYVDLFAGTGVCTVRMSGKRIPGSVLIAASTSKPFARIIACEKNRAHAEACKARLNRTLVANRCRVLIGDCNKEIDQVAALIPEGALTLAFIDPTGLDARFETIAVLSRQRKVDFVVLFADAYDISRNAEYYYRRDPNSKLDQVLGPSSGWREKLDELDPPTAPRRRRLFADIYKDQLRKHLGYAHFGEKTISSTDKALYRLIYASKHELGEKFWNESLKKEASGQRHLFD